MTDSINTINKTFNTAGTYLLSLIVYNDTCNDTANITVTVTQPIQTTLNPSICEGRSLCCRHSYIYCYRNILTHLLLLLFCDSIVTTHLTVNLYPIINLGQNTSICSGQIIELNKLSLYFISMAGWKLKIINSLLARPEHIG